MAACAIRCPSPACARRRQATPLCPSRAPSFKYHDAAVRDPLPAPRRHARRARSIAAATPCPPPSAPLGVLASKPESDAATPRRRHLESVRFIVGHAGGKPAITPSIAVRPAEEASIRWHCGRRRNSGDRRHRNAARRHGRSLGRLPRSQGALCDDVHRRPVGRAPAHSHWEYPPGNPPPQCRSPAGTIPLPPASITRRRRR